VVGKLQILQAAKDAAVLDEDFDTAMAYKEVSDRLKVMGNDLLTLEARKATAISNEDFE
jgi:hypothetical protein